MSLHLRSTPDGTTLSLRVHPGAKHNAITGTHDGALKVSLTAPPSDGRANDALIALLADHLRIPKSQIILIAGHTGRAKVIRVAALTPAEVEARLFNTLA